MTHIRQCSANRLALVKLAFAGGFVASVLVAQAPAGSAVGRPAQPNSSSFEDYGKLPLSFEANRGQSDPSVRFLSRGNGYSLFLTGSGAVLALGNPEKGSNFTEDVVRMTLAGASATSLRRIAGSDPLPGKVNYFLGSDPTRWRANIPTYAKVRYRSIYPGVDLVYYGNQYGNRRQLEYDFIVAPNADPRAIRLRFSGERRLALDAGGDLVLESVHGTVSLHKPALYQQIGGRRESVSGQFRLLTANSVGFSVGTYDHAHPLIIDPVLVYSTYLGGSGNGRNGDQGNGIAVDAAGSAYFVGTTYSADFPVTGEAFQSADNANQAGHGSTVFVAKLNPAGTALVYSTYLGGSGSASGGDFGYGIALDAASDAYVTGATNSTDFPVTCGAFQATNPSATTGATTGFVAKLNATGNALQYATYLGGSGNQTTPAHGDVAQAIAVDSSGDAYLTGYTWSEDFPVTDGAFQANNNGVKASPNSFVTRLNPTGTALVYSTFLGGSGASGAGDYGNSIAINSSGDAFVAGSTASANFPVTSGSAQTSLAGTFNAFVTELNPTGTAAVYSTYLGGSGADSAQAIAVDSSGSAYLAGNTTSADFPLTAGVVEGANSGIESYISQGSGAFAAKLNKTGSALTYSTYLEGINISGAGAIIAVTGLAVDSAGNAYISGSSPAVGAGAFGAFQVTPGALPTPTTAANSAFLVKLSPSAATLKYATLLGGTSNNGDGANALALDRSGNAYLTGAAYSTNFPVTGAAFQKANNGAGTATNAFVAKLAVASESNASTYPMLATSIGTTLTGTGSVLVDCVDNEIIFALSVTLNTASYGPPPTGFIELDEYGPGFPQPLPYSVWGGGAFYQQAYETIDPPYGSGPFTAPWGAGYFGDALYSGSYASGYYSFAGCPYPTDAHTDASHRNAPKFKVRTQIAAVTGSAQSAAKSASTSSMLQSGSPVGVSESTSSPNRSRVGEPKFTPLTLESIGTPVLARTASIEPREAPACVEVKPSLTVTLLPAAPSRLYGAANPKFSYSVSGLLKGDSVTVTPTTTANLASPVGTYPVSAIVSGAAAADYNVYVAESELTVLPAPLTVTLFNNWREYGEANPAFGSRVSGLIGSDTVTVSPQTAATPTSAVGTYPVTATVSGASASNYAVTVQDSILYVVKAPLNISARTVAISYGQTPPPITGYFLTGFRNGENASFVTGAPALSSTVTATSPVGFYPITVGVGTLAAQNYSFITFSAGMGLVGVYKIPLTIRPNSFAIHAGDPLPAFTYTITGFVNGDTQSSATTGAPVLTTTAPNNTTPGRYYILANPGSLAARNYYFELPNASTNGFLTILSN